jgi:hypothetical protein
LVLQNGLAHLIVHFMIVISGLEERLGLEVGYLIVTAFAITAGMTVVLLA